MKKLSCLTVVLLVLGGIIGTLVAQDIDVLVINKTGYMIYELYMSPSYADDWEEDVLGSEILDDNGTFTVTFTGYGEQCVFDLKAVDQDGDEYFQWSLNICDQQKVVITLDDMYVGEEGGLQDFTLINNTGFILNEIYVSPSYADDWEEDLLDGRILEDGEPFEVSFSGYGEHCNFDIKVVDTDGDIYTKWGVDLCSIWEVEMTIDDYYEE